MRLAFAVPAHPVRAVATACALAAFAGAAGAAPFDVLDAVQNGVEAVTDLDAPRALAASPDGAHVYAAVSFSSAVTGFAVDAATGALTPSGSVVDGFAGADGLLGCVDLAISPDGAHVYVAGFGDDAIAILARDAETGALSFVDAVLDSELETPALDGVSGVALSPDGAHLYATAGLADTVVAFARNAESGLLTLIEVEDDDPSQLLDGAAEVAVSPLGDRVYVVAQEAAPNGGSLVTFSRGPATGAIARIDAEQDGVDSVSGLAFPNSLAVSPDGAHVYTVAGHNSFTLLDAVALFERWPIDGTTRFLGRWSNGANGVEGIDYAIGVAVAPDGAYVYVTGVGDDALAVFARDAGTGLLSFDRAIFDADDPARLFGAAIDVAVDPNGRFVYVASFAEDAITVLAPEPGAAPLAAAACAALALRGRRARPPRRISR